MQKQSYAERFVTSLRTRGFLGLFKQAWIRCWMHFVGIGPAGRFAAWLVTWFAPPHYDRWELREMNPKGFVSPKATLYGKGIHLDRNVFVDDYALVCQNEDGGPITIGPKVAIARNAIVQTALGGTISIGENSRLQPNCFLSAAQGSIHIGKDVGVAPYCAFYPHNHGTSGGRTIASQPLNIRGDIVVEDGAWLGHGVTVLSGVRIGKGAVVGAGSTVATDVPDGAIVWGVPARKIMTRKESATEVSPSKETSVVSQDLKGAKSA